MPDPALPALCVCCGWQVRAAASRASQQRECEAFVRARTLSRSHVHVMVNHPAEGEVMHLAQV